MTVIEKPNRSARGFRDALRQGHVIIRVGPFDAKIRGSDASFLDHMEHHYLGYRQSSDPAALTDQTVTIKSPNLRRRIFRRQVVADTGFGFPFVPLPSRLAPLAFEMGLNLSVALKIYRYLILHAGVVADDDNAILISAESGGGKSTLTAALMAEGMQLFSDEFGIIDLESAEVLAYPRPVSLKNQSIDVARTLFDPGCIGPKMHETPKGDIAYLSPRNRDITGAKLGAEVRLVIFPKFEKEGEARLNPLSPIDAMMRLIAGSTNYHVIGEKAFLVAKKIVEKAAAFEISYQNTDQSLRLVEDAKRLAGL